jgi:hypothetical protein
MARFGAIPFLQLGIGSRADWVANLLLFIPLSFLWMGALAAGGSTLRTLMAALALVPLAAALSVGIEFTQLFFPQRTVSRNDILAETLGRLVARWLGGARDAPAMALAQPDACAGYAYAGGVAHLDRRRAVDAATQGC